MVAVLIIILIVAGVFLALSATIFYLVSQLARAKGLLFAANRDAHRARQRQEAARKAAREAQDRCEQLVGQLDNSIAHTGQALNCRKRHTDCRTPAPRADRVHRRRCGSTIGAARAGRDAA